MGPNNSVKKRQILDLFGRMEPGLSEHDNLLSLTDQLVQIGTPVEIMAILEEINREGDVGLSPAIHSAINTIRAKPYLLPEKKVETGGPWVIDQSTDTKENARKDGCAYGWEDEVVLLLKSEELVERTATVRIEGAVTCHECGASLSFDFKHWGGPASRTVTCDTCGVDVNLVAFDDFDKEKGYGDSERGGRSVYFIARPHTAHGEKTKQSIRIDVEKVTSWR